MNECDVKNNYYHSSFFPNFIVMHKFKKENKKYLGNWPIFLRKIGEEELFGNILFLYFASNLCVLKVMNLKVYFLEIIIKFRACFCAHLIQ